MEALTWGFIGTLIGAAVGATASVVTTVINTKNTHALQRKVDAAKKDGQHNDFQCENLMKVQDELSSNMRLIFEAHLSDVKYYKENPASSKKPLLQESLDIKIRESNQQLSILTERVSDDTLRRQIQEVRDQLTNVIMASSESESLHAINHATSNISLLMSNIGVHIRNSYQR